MKKIIFTSILSLATITSSASELLFLQNTNVKNTVGKIQSDLSVSKNVDLRQPFSGIQSVLSYRSGMQINPKAFDANEISITLSDGKQINASRTKRYMTDFTKSTVWVGKNIKAKPGTIDYAASEIILVLRNGRVTGHVSEIGKYYKIGANEKGEHTLAELSTTQSLPSHPLHGSLQPIVIPALDALTPTSYPAQLTNNLNKPLRRNLGREVAEFDQETFASQINSSIAPLPGVSVYRVLVNYTSAAAQNFPDILGEIESRITQTNKLYEDSGVNVRVTLAYAAPITFTETSSIKNDMATYAGMSEVNSQRNLYKADVAALFSIAQDACGIGVFNANANSAVVNVNVQPTLCPTVVQAFGHELGHIFGAGHDIPNDPKPWAREYQHGYHVDIPNLPQGFIGVRTIMSYPETGKNRAIVPYFSTPRLTINGIAIGDAATADNVRVHNERATAVAAFLPPPTVFSGTRNAFRIEKTNTSFNITRNADSITESIPKLGAKSFTFEDVIVNLESADKSKTIPLATLNSLIELYVAFNNRVPDSDGLGYWIDQSKAGKTLDQIADSFYAASILYPEETGYSSTMTNSDFIIKVYQNVLRRTVTASDSGVIYWANEISSGRQSRGKVVNTLITSARTFKNDPVWGWTVTLLDNKLSISKLFSLSYGLNYKTPQLNIIKCKAIANAVTATDVNAAKALIGVTDTAFDLLN